MGAEAKRDAMANTHDIDRSLLTIRGYVGIIHSSRGIAATIV